MAQSWFRRTLLLIPLAMGVMALSCSDERALPSRPLAHNLYISNDKLGYIYSLDPDSLLKIDSIRTGTLASYIAPSPDGRSLAVQTWGEPEKSGLRRYQLQQNALSMISPGLGLIPVSFVAGDRWLLLHSSRPKLVDAFSLQEFDFPVDSLIPGENLPGDFWLAAVVGGSHRVRKVNLATSEIAGLYDPTDVLSIRSVHLHPDGRRILVAGDAIRDAQYGAIFLVGDLETGDKLFEWHQWSQAAPTSIVLSLDGNHCFVSSNGIAGYGYRGYIDVYDLQSPMHLTRLQFGDSAPLYPAPVVPLPDGRSFIVATDWYQISNAIQIFDLPTLALSPKIELGGEDEFWVGGIAVGPRRY